MISVIDIFRAIKKRNLIKWRLVLYAVWEFDEQYDYEQI